MLTWQTTYSAGCFDCCTPVPAVRVAKFFAAQGRRSRSSHARRLPRPRPRARQRQCHLTSREIDLAYRILHFAWHAFIFIRLPQIRSGSDLGPDLHCDGKVLIGAPQRPLQDTRVAVCSLSPFQCPISTSIRSSDGRHGTQIAPLRSGLSPTDRSRHSQGSVSRDNGLRLIRAPAAHRHGCVTGGPGRPLQHLLSAQPRAGRPVRLSTADRSVLGGQYHPSYDVHGCEETFNNRKAHLPPLHPNANSVKTPIDRLRGCGPFLIRSPAADGPGPQDCDFRGSECKLSTVLP